LGYVLVGLSGRSSLLPFGQAQAERSGGRTTMPSDIRVSPIRQIRVIRGYKKTSIEGFGRFGGFLAGGDY